MLTGAQRAVRPQHNAERVLLTPNDFPYFVEGWLVISGRARVIHSPTAHGLEGVAHYVLWFEHGSVVPATVAAVTAVQLADHDILWYENPPGARTVPGLAHVQVFARPRTP
jgi:hypothetical protein